MTDNVNDGKRNLLKTAMLGAAAGAVAPSLTLAQMLETNIREDSVLAKIRRDGVINVGYAQTGPWFYKDAKTGELGGIYKDVVDMLAKEIQIKVEWKEVTFANSTVGLRRGDYDLFGSSLVYLVQRALGVRYGGTLFERHALSGSQRQCRAFQDRGRPQRPERHHIGDYRGQRGAAHSATAAEGAEGDHYDRANHASGGAGS